VDYKIIVGHSAFDMTTKVKMHMEKGWRLEGTLLKDTNYFFQAVTRQEFITALTDELGG